MPRTGVTGCRAWSAHSPKQPPAEQESSAPNGADRDRGAVAASGWSAIPVADPLGHATPSEASRVAERIETVREALRTTWKVREGALEGIGWLIRNDRAWAHGCREWPFDAWTGQPGWRSVSVGLRAFGFDSGGQARPSNDFLRWLGDSLVSRQVDLTGEEWRCLLEREPVSVPGVKDGYAALRLGGLPLGRGFIRSGLARHEIPGVHARSLARSLD